MKIQWMVLFAAMTAFGCAVPAEDTGAADAGPAADLCGNNVIDEGEECDDGAKRNGDGCDRNCVLENNARCGDGVVEGDEECDDRNTFPGDGCDERCRNENLADGNDSFEDAQALEGSQVEGVIATPGDIDFYKFEVEAGQWVAISTTANAEDNPAKIDTVVTLYGPDQNQLAENDDAYPRRNTDSQLITKVVTSGTHYLKLQEFTTWYGETAEGQSDYTYSLNINVLSTEDIGGGAVYGVEGDEAIALDTETKALILGDLADSNDVDMYSFSVTDETKAHFTAQLMPLGTEGYGSTAQSTKLWVSDSNGDIVARITHVDKKTDEVGPGGLALGDYNLHVQHGGGAAGANDFYVMKFNLYGDNPPEAEEDTNGVLGTAEALTPSVDGESTRYFVLAQLSEGDVDYYSFDLAEGKAMTVACGSESSGSGVRGFRVELRNADDEVISGTDENDEGAYIQQIAGQSAGTYYIRLSATGVDADVTSRFARCGVHTGPARRQ